MNIFQQKLLALSDSMRKASERVCQSTEVSQLDIDVLKQRMRELYDFLLTADYEEKAELPEITPIAHIEVVEEEKPVVEEKKEEVVEEVKEEKKIEIVVEEPKEEVKQEVIEIKEELPKVEEEVVEVKEEVIEVEEEIIEIEEEIPEVKEEVVEVKETVIEEPKEEVKEEKEVKKGSVLDYLHNNIMKDNDKKHHKTEEYQTLDLFKSPPSIAEKFENKNRSDLRTAIGVGEKFMFINDLFSGDLKAYTNFINMLNEASSLEMSMIVIEENRNKRKWIKNSLAYSTLESLVEKRFRK